MIKEFVEEVCSILNMKLPNVSYDTSCFLTDTTIAQCDISSNTIYLKETESSNPDYLFAIAHELRHLWQAATDRETYFSDYQTADILGKERYNSQAAEVDANAFAGLIMIQFFHLQPLWQGLSDNNIRKINSRMNDIALTFQS